MSQQPVIRVPRSVLEHIDEGVLLLDAQGNVEFENKMYQQLPAELREMLRLRAIQKRLLPVSWFDEHCVKSVALESGSAVLVSTSKRAQTLAEQTLKTMISAFEQNPDIYAAATDAIQQCLGWRWVAITRFNAPRHLEVLSIVDNQQTLSNYDYDIAGTPCELVVDSNQFTVFADVESQFPDHSAMQEMGAKTFAGLIYRGTDNQALGHVMAMHDHSDVDFGAAEDVIRIATVVLASQFQLHSTVTQLETAKQEGRMDSMTGIGNRLAFDDCVAQALGQYRHGDQKAWTIAIVDLDNLKPLNDQVGHAAGDSFIKLMASELASLGRQTDRAFRLGGDEFAIVFEHDAHDFTDVIKLRFRHVIQRIRANLRFDIDASIGFASLAEVNGDAEMWFKLADQRMYRQKKKHQTEQHPKTMQ